MISEVKKIASTKKDLVNFGRVMSVAFLIIGTIGLIRHHDGAAWWLSASGLMLASSILTPRLLLPFQKIWMTFGLVMGWLMAHVVLIIVFYGVMTPLRFIARLFGKKFLELSFDKKASTYWIRKEAVVKEPALYEKQF
jgi:hypothetical protein